jgi:2',3'-cyclic-nucleotide 2'-phosphodiesterase (5'-nucleotidase family)
MKQQILSQEDRYVVLASPEDTIVELYPGVKNTGIVYAATYGRGVFRCENYKLNSGTDIPEVPSVAAEANVSIYPNPAYSQATARFEAEGNATVRYQVFDLTGRLVMSRNLGRLNQGSHDIEINTGDLGTGSYILRIGEGVRTATAKFLVY